jgi:hypothetical protein
MRGDSGTNGLGKRLADPARFHFFRRWSLIVYGLVLIAAGRAIPRRISTHDYAFTNQFSASEQLYFLRLSMVTAGLGLCLILYHLPNPIWLVWRRHLQREHPDEAWVWDYPWKSSGGIKPSCEELFRRLFWLAQAAVATALGAWFMTALVDSASLDRRQASQQKQDPQFFRENPEFFHEPMIGEFLGPIFMGGFILALWAGGLYMAARAWKEVKRFARDRGLRLLTTGFPLYLGERMQVRLEGLGGLQSMSGVTAVLRCVEERLVIEWYWGIGKRYLRIMAVRWELYSQELALGPRQTSPSGQAQYAISCPLPDADLSTNLSGLRPRYWELQIKSKDLPLDYDATFLLPIYDK